MTMTLTTRRAGILLLLLLPLLLLQLLRSWRRW